MRRESGSRLAMTLTKMSSKARFLPAATLIAPAELTASRRKLVGLAAPADLCSLRVTDKSYKRLARGTQPIPTSEVCDSEEGLDSKKCAHPLAHLRTRAATRRD